MSFSSPPGIPSLPRAIIESIFASYEVKVPHAPWNNQHMILLLSLEYSSTSPYFFVLPLSEAPVMSVILFEEGSLLVSQNWIAAQLGEEPSRRRVR